MSHTYVHEDVYVHVFVYIHAIRLKAMSSAACDGFQRASKNTHIVYSMATKGLIRFRCERKTHPSGQAGRRASTPPCPPDLNVVAELCGARAKMGVFFATAHLALPRCQH